MPGRADRQEFGDSLDDCQKDYLQGLGDHRSTKQQGSGGLDKFTNNDGFAIIGVHEIREWIRGESSGSAVRCTDWNDPATRDRYPAEPNTGVTIAPALIQAFPGRNAARPPATGYL